MFRVVAPPLHLLANCGMHRVSSHAVTLVLAVACALGLPGCDVCGLPFTSSCSCDLSSGGCSGPSTNSFEAMLSGNNVVPPVTTTASGSARFNLNANTTAVTYTITVSNLTSADSAQLFVGSAGQNGTARITLCAPCVVSGSNVLATGTASVTPAIVTSMRAFGTHLEIRTASGPVLRGQLRVVG